MRFLRKLADSHQGDSLAVRLRRKRFSWFQELLASHAPPIRILDVGGAEDFWQKMEMLDVGGVSILLLNLEPAPAPRSRNIEAITGDARDLARFEDDSFDIVFSNSVIEHVGDFSDQQRMADEIRRVGRSYFVQTPNRYFPIEPHFLFPFFQFLPREVQIFVLTHFSIGWAPKAKDRQEAENRAASIRLLTRRECTRLLPGATLYRERFLGLTKSLVLVHDGRNRD